MTQSTVSGPVVPKRVLIIDDEKMLQDLWRRKLDGWHLDIVVEHAFSLVEGLAMMAANHYDLVALDGALSGSNSEQQTYAFLMEANVQAYIASGGRILAISSYNDVNDQMKRLGAVAKVSSKSVVAETIVMVLSL